MSVFLTYLHLKYRNLKKSFIKCIGNFFCCFPINSNKVVMDNFSGRGYGDNPKYIAEAIRKHNLPWKIIWLTYETNSYYPEWIKPVKYGTLQAMYHLATAKIWIDNVRGTERPKKRSEQIYLQTWHSPGGVKRLEAEIEDILPKTYIEKAKIDGRICDGIVSASQVQYDKMKNYFWLGTQTEILKSGSPRNDLLLDSVHQNDLKIKLYREFNVPDNHGVVLYMPTFRDNHSTDGYNMDFEGILDTFKKKFKKEFVLIVRLHPSVPNQSQCMYYSKKIINGSFYPDAQELYSIGDFLISDYSSSPFDFSLLRKPVFLYIFDIQDNKKRLSSIFDILPFPKAENNSQLMDCILSFDEEKYWNDYEVFADIWQSFDQGNAAEKIVKWLIKKKGKQI